MAAHRRVAVRADEIQRQPLPRAVGQGLVDPTASRGGRPPNPVGGVDRFHGAHGGFVEPVVFGPGDRGELGVALAPRRAHPKTSKVRLVPDLKVPAAYLLGAVTLRNVTNERGDESLPFRVVLGWGDVGLVPEDRVRAAGEGSGHEAQLHEGLHPDALEKIEKLIHILPVVNCMTLFVLLVHAHVVAKQSVETDVAEATLGAYVTKLPLPIGPQALVGAPRADAEVVHSTGRAAGVREVSVDDA